MVVALLAVAIVVGGVGYSVGRLSTLFAGTPGTDSVEAGFARDMQVHHNQGVELAMIIYPDSDDAGIRSVAYDIATAQAQQSGQMYGWLTTWGVPQYSTDPPMSWMSDDGSHGHDGTAVPMPGLATAAQIDELEAATGAEADRVFLQLMIAHHRGAIEMARDVLERSDQHAVVDLATSIVRSQTSEIDLLQDLLEGLPAA
ncbi:DUF305 domain-containing protein [Naasia lichenicola]|uniref:DUF305 domain-containing protein n=2 Tax=Naasia lichenicola TaxID=2565933 RepID=A0A4S4FIS0_9MICO|nr:DUF305 domain-containing protein [Naasia lichenicola]